MANIFNRLGSWASRQAFGSGPQDTYGSQFDDAAKKAAGYGSRATDTYLRRAEGFDAMKTLSTAAGGLYDQFDRDIGQKLEGVRGHDVGAGRLSGGYGELDEASTTYDARRNLNDTIAQMALQAEGLQMQNDQGLGSFGQQETGQSLDIMAGQRDAEMARYNARTNARSQLFGTVSGIAGQFLGGGGAGVLSKIGGKIGGMFNRGGGPSATPTAMRPSASLNDLQNLYQPDPAWVDAPTGRGMSSWQVGTTPRR